MIVFYFALQAYDFADFCHYECKLTGYEYNNCQTNKVLND